MYNSIELYISNIFLVVLTEDNIMFDKLKLVKSMNAIKNYNEEPSNFECSSFTDNLIEAYDINQCDTSITLMEKEVVSESIDRAVWVALEVQLIDVEKTFTEAEDVKDDAGEGKGKKRNIFVRAWLKFKSWIVSFWNWITGKKGKKNDSMIDDIKSDLSKSEPEVAAKLSKKKIEYRSNIKKVMKKVTAIQKEVDSILKDGGNLKGGVWNKLKGGLKKCVGMAKNSEDKITGVLKKINKTKMSDKERNDIAGKLLDQYEAIEKSEHVSKKFLDDMLAEINKLQP